VKSLKLSFAAVMLIISGFSYAQRVEIKVIRYPTQEVKNFQATNRPFDIDISWVQGWKQCTVSPINEYTHSPAGTSLRIKRMNIKLYCSTTNNQVITQDCDVNETDVLDFRRFTLTGSGSKINTQKDSIDALTAATFELSCWFR
jgi:hypothetical protein